MRGDGIGWTKTITVMGDTILWRLSVGDLLKRRLDLLSNREVLAAPRNGVYSLQDFNKNEMLLNDIIAEIRSRGITPDEIQAFENKVDQPVWDFIWEERDKGART